MHSAPAGFTERVMANLPEAPSCVSEPPQRAGLIWPRFALGLALIAIVTVFAFEFLEKPQREPQVASKSLEGSSARLAGVESVSAEPLTFPVPKITSEQLQALTTRLDQPLEKELENVISDTRQAIQFVASNFLPEK